MPSGLQFGCASAFQFVRVTSTVIPVSRRVYSNPPIAEAVCEIRYVGQDPADPTLAGRLQERLKPTYDGRPREQHLMRAELSSGGSPGASTQLIPETRIQLLDASGTRMLTVGHNVLSTSDLFSPIDTWRSVALQCELLTPSGKAQIVSMHLMTPRTGFEAILQQGPAGLPELQNVIEKRRQEAKYVQHKMAEYSGPTLISGDFNMPVRSQIYQECWGQYQNAFSQSGIGWGFTKYTRWHGVRVDQVLGDSGWKFRKCSVSGPQGSDHRASVAEAVLLSANQQPVKEVTASAAR